MSSPFRSRFGGTFRLDFYTPKDVERIILRSAGLLGVEIDEDAIATIAGSSRATPRTANRLLKRVRDYVQVHGSQKIDCDSAKKALTLLQVDEIGLEPSDKHILDVIINKYGGGPVGVKTIAASCGEEEETIESVYEPYLMRLGFIARTPKGRIATELAYQHMNISSAKDISQQNIFEKK